MPPMSYFKKIFELQQFNPKQRIKKENMFIVNVFRFMQSVIRFFTEIELHPKNSTLHQRPSISLSPSMKVGSSEL